MTLQAPGRAVVDGMYLLSCEKERARLSGPLIEFFSCRRSRRFPGATRNHQDMPLLPEQSNGLLHKE